MSFFNIKSQASNLIKDGILKDVKKFLLRGNYINGHQNKLLEKKLSNFTGSKYCVVCSSGTDAIMASLLSLNLKSGDEVITSAYSWISASEIIKLLKLKLVFADINIKTYNLDLQSVKKKINNKTKAIIPVSLFGQCADLIKIKQLTKNKNITIIEDAAQSLGAKINKLNSCNIADISCTSFFPTKSLGGYGDGGAIFTNKYNLYNKINNIVNHGSKNRKKFNLVGMNARMDTLQAIFLLKKFSYLKKNISYRNNIAKKYNKFFTYNKILGYPKIIDNFKSVYTQYTICVKNRKRLENIFKKKNISYKIYYSRPIYKEKAYLQKIKLKNTEFVCKHSISLPLETKSSRTTIKLLNQLLNKGIFFK